MSFAKIIHHIATCIERAQSSQRFHVLLVYFSILLDNLLLTVVVPVVPDYLVDLHYGQNVLVVDDNKQGDDEMKWHDGQMIIDQTNQTKPISEPFGNIVADQRLAINGRSMAILNHIDPNLNTENGQVGAILSSKAFVQLVFNPLVSPIINHLGYELTLILGVAVLLHSCLLYLIGQSFMLLLIPRALQGIASALINISGMSMIANMFRDEQARTGTIGFCLGGMATGVLIGYPFGSLLYEWFGKSIMFAFIVAFILLLLAAQLVTFNWSPTNAPTLYDSKTIHIITNRKVIFFIVIICVSTVTMSLLESFLPIWLIKEIRPPKWKLGIVFIPDSIGYLLGTNVFNLFPSIITIESRWLLVIIALWAIGISAFLVPLIPNLLYLSMPHFGIGFGIGSIDAALMPMLAELVDELFAAQYGYVYTASQTASSAAYAFGPLLGGALLNGRWLRFETLMHLIGLANLVLCLACILQKTTYDHFGKNKLQRPPSIGDDYEPGAVDKEILALQQTYPLPPTLTTGSCINTNHYQRLD